MSKTSASWDHYRAMLAVADTGSLSAAARKLGLTQPTIGRQIDTLELALGLTLFVRSPAGLVLTDSGQDLMAEARAMAAAAEGLARTASAGRDEARGLVRITASEVIGGEVMPAILTRLRRTYPGLVLELALTNRSEDLLRRDADIAVRMIQPSQSAVVARRIGSIGLGLYGHRDYLTRHGFPHSLADLSAHAIIGFDRDDSAARSVGFEMESLRRAMAFRCDSDLAKMAALRAGFGLGVCQKPLAARNQDLIPVLSDQINFNLDMWLAMHEDQRRSRRIRLVFDFLVTELQRYVEFRE